LFSIFVAEAFKAKGEQFSEIQVIFYPINESASFAHTLNIAQFPIPIKEFSTIMEQKMDPIQSMTIGRFLNIVNSYYLRDIGSPVYGMNSLYGRRVKKDREATTKRKRNRNFKKADVFSAKKLEILARAYGLKEESDFTFRMPQVTVKYESAPSEDADDPKAAPILRIHVMDQACGKAEQLKDILMGFGGDGTFAEKTRTDSRKTNGARIPEHGKTITENITTLKTAELIDGPDEKGLYTLKRTGDGTSFAFDLKEKIKTMFPSVTYGAANSNMIQADLSTMADSGMNTIMMINFFNFRTNFKKIFI